ncbi:MAG TPA: AGE family epimerase/isomerase [Puia sp.]|jgi:mannobiose 2-epimerase
MKVQDNHPPTQHAGKAFSAEIRSELDHILDYWKRFSVDCERGGFVGKADNANRPVPGAAKAAVLNSRILWTFSAAWPVTKDPEQLALATTAYDYIRDHFSDPVHGGLFWSVDAGGNPQDTRKQVYAQSFGIYGMSEYYRATGNEEALALAIEWYRLIEQYGLDKQHGGYIDAFARDWSFLEDKRLSPKDDNAVKTTNTHLHLIEAYANLYEVWPDPLLRVRIRELLALFQEKILNKNNYHLELFFDAEWNRKPGAVSYGHDIEAGWLLQSCAESISDEAWITRTKANALRISDAAMEGLDEDGGLWNEPDTEKSLIIKEKHWWPQAEMLIGLCNAWQISATDRYQQAMLKNWQFIKKYIRDKENGEWFWGINEDHSVMPGQDKIGPWKCPYHNGRACLQLIKRLTP